MPAKRLVIISHTAHYEYNGIYYGWGPTIKEINKVAPEFESVVHFAPLHAGAVPGGNMPYTASNIKYIKLLEAGGTNFTEKVKLFLFAPINVFFILKELKTTDWIQLRAPSNIALIMLPVLSILRFYHKWVKYAGNWSDSNAALTYRIQRWWLKNNLQGSKVTVNGKWESDGKHVLAFENPCMDEVSLISANAIAKNKSYSNPLNICFVGQLDEGKGIVNLFDAFKLLSTEELSKINKVFVVGDGPLMNTLKEKRNNIKLDIELLGYLDHDQVADVYVKSHINILPSRSEGFPKVIAEGAAYGCIPVVTDMSSLGQYVNNSNGLLLPTNSPEDICQAIRQILYASASQRVCMAMNATKLAEKFTYEHYIHRVFSEIINK